MDPDGLSGEPEHDPAIPMREFNDELLAGAVFELGQARACNLARLTGTDAQRIWEWGFVERVSTGLLLLKERDVAGGTDFLHVAERWGAQ